MSEDFYHDDDLLPENIEGNLNYYSVECWSNERFPVRDGTVNDVQVAAVYTSFDGAAEFCKRHPNYGGSEDNWHWRINRGMLNKDPLNTVGPRSDWWKFDRHMRELERIQNPNFKSKEDLKNRIDYCEDAIEEISSKLGEFKNELEELRLELEDI